MKWNHFFIACYFSQKSMSYCGQLAMLLIVLCCTFVILLVHTCICWCICICNIQLWGNVLWIADASSVGHWQPSEEEVSATVPWCPLLRRRQRILNQDKQQENISITTGCSPCPPIKNRNQRAVYCCLATLKYLSSRIKWSFANVYLLAAQCV